MVGQEGFGEPRRENRPQDAFLILLFESIFFMRNKKSNILFRILLNSWWAEMDSNHRTLTRTDLQSAAFSHSAICPFSHLKNNKWCTLKDSNLGPTGYEPVALTNWAIDPSAITIIMLKMPFVNQILKISEKCMVFLLVCKEKCYL